MTADDWLANTKVSYDTVATSYAAQVREALDGKPYLRSALALLVDLVRAVGGGPVADVGCGPAGHCCSGPTPVTAPGGKRKGTAAIR